ncbi:MAG: hypothetical protein ACKVE4_09260 [Dissulfuribacterales bacterium]
MNTKNTQNIKLSLKINIDKLFFYLLFLFICLTPFIRYFGGALFIAFLVIEIAYLISIRKNIFYPSLTAFTLLGFLYIVLSYANLLPSAWTHYFISSAIPQQSSCIIAFYPTILAARRQWQFIFSRTNPNKYLWPLFIAGCVIAPLLSAYSGGHVVSCYVSSNNAMAFSFIAILYYLASGGKKRRVIGAFGLLFLSLLLGGNAQIKMIGIVVFILLLTPCPRFVLVCAVCSIISVFVVILVILFYNEIIFDIWDFDPNTGVRFLFSKDALSALVSSAGLGVGFGKEAIVNYYPMINHTHVNLATKGFYSFVMTSIHNSFIAVFYRLGIIGGILFSWFIFIVSFPCRFKQIRDTRLACSIFFITFLTLFVNVAFESPTYIVGMGYMIGLLLFMKKSLVCLHSSYSQSIF